MTIANIHASYEFGVRVFDSSVAGLGRRPYAKRREHRLWAARVSLPPWHGHIAAISVASVFMGVQINFQTQTYSRRSLG